ncbi:hypothetical protein ACP70R_010205 [Stipagrostis hirtigluma subsp. patula]
MADANSGNNNSGAANASGGEVQIQIPAKVEGSATQEAPSRSSGVKNWRWWLVVAAEVLFLIAGETSATLLGRYYYDQGGCSKWMFTFVQTAGFPILFFALFFFPSKSYTGANGGSSDTPMAKIALIYIVLGLIIAADDMLYANGLIYLSASTYSLICTSQLPLNVVFSYVLNSQKLTTLILNSVVLLTLSASLLGINERSQGPAGVSTGRYLLGFLLTLGASATYSLTLSLMQLTFENVIKKHTFSAVINMQIYTSLVATFASLVGLFASGEWRDLKGEMDRFHSGEFSYLMTLVWSAVAWQVASLGAVGLVFEVSSLFSNATTILALPVVPLFAVIVFHDKMEAVKVIILLIAIWGYFSYLCQHYLDDKKARKAISNTQGNP